MSQLNVAFGDTKGGSMITFKSPGFIHNAGKTFQSCDLFSRTSNIPNVTVWAKGETDPIGLSCDGWVDIVVDHSYLDQPIVMDVLSAHFKVKMSDIVIL